MNGQSLIDIPYKTGYLNLKIYGNGNKNAVILIPGQSLPAEMFFGLPLYDDKTSIADKIVSAGFDVVYLDPVGYGRSKGTINELYTRDIMADQMILAVNNIRGQYNHIFLHGFCSTCHVPMITANKVKVEGIVLQSPLIYEVKPDKIQEYMARRDPDNIILTNSLDNLKNKRLKRSDIIVGKSIKAANWEQVFLDHLETFDNFKERGKWFGSNDMVWDLWLYDSANGSQGWQMELIKCPIAVIKGQYDFECRANYREFLEIIKDNLVLEAIAPNATHFGMWDKDYDLWAKSFIDCLLNLLEAN